MPKLSKIAEMRSRRWACLRCLTHKASARLESLFKLRRSGDKYLRPMAMVVHWENSMSSESKHFKEGLAVRREVLGAEYVDSSIAKADDFMTAFQNITTEWCWGYAWTRPGLDRKTRSMLNLAMLTALKAPNEIKLHVKGALTNGVTVDEIKEILLHATVYSGIPAGLEAFKAAHEVLVAEGVLKSKTGGSSK